MINRLQSLEAGPRDWRRWPWKLWCGLAALAVAGSMLYGASLGLIRPEWSQGGAALVTLSAGLSWCLLGPALAVVTSRRLETLAHATLVSMAAGEVVLLLMALANVVLSADVVTLALPAHHNLAWSANLIALVGVNLLMAGVLAWQLGEVQVAPWKTLATWLVVLDGGGLILFLLLRAPLLAR